MRVHRERRDSGVLVDEENLLPRLAAVDRTEHAALFAAVPQGSASRDIDTIGPCRMDHDLADVLGGFQADMLEALAPIDRFVDAIAEARALTVVWFARADPDRIRIGTR